MTEVFCRALEKVDGSYSFTSHPDIARRILADKLKGIELVGCSLCGHGLSRMPAADP